eukprot:TRINITY_DN1444_c0_g2_i1.p1 TRINITY_DN1444_c0_g2~~TRINITY_DN1444_c0_g2_i1.p1  ORF type:complete len:496 (+),score=106.81 TRINITY_DN1444_c0_g2_i1:52-1539(+)
MCIRDRSLFDGICIIVGIIIGSGIFSSPGVAMSEAGTAQSTLLVWFCAGLLCLWGSLCYAELGVAYPHAGGEYHYFDLAFGPVGGFFFTWANLWVYRTGSIAIIALIFSRYVGATLLLGLDVTDPDLDQNFGVKLLAMACIIGLTVLNSMGVEFGTIIQNVFTVIKLGLMAIMLMAGVGYLGSEGSNTVATNFDNSDGSSTTMAGFGTAMIAALWAFDGWNNVNYVTEELKNPEVNTLRSILAGLSIVTGSYVIANLCYLIVLDAATIKNSKAIAIDYAEAAIGGEAARTIAAILVGLSAFGAANGSILTGSRSIMAAARDGQLPLILGKIHPTRGTPIAALAVQGAWSCLLLLPSDFEQLLNYFGIVSWLFYGLSGVSLIVLRNSDPDKPRPYKVLWYPFTPIMLITSSAFLILSLFINDPLPSFCVVAFLGMSVPVHYLRVYVRRRWGWGTDVSTAGGQMETEREMEMESVPTNSYGDQPGGGPPMKEDHSGL